MSEERRFKCLKLELLRRRIDKAVRPKQIFFAKMTGIAVSLDGCEADTFDEKRIIVGTHPGWPFLPTLKLLHRLRGDAFERFARLVRTPEISKRRGNVLEGDGITRAQASHLAQCLQCSREIA